jgi:DNA mismatch repair protein MutL
LFERQPARRKFLRSAGSETNAIAAVVSHYALAYPEVRFRLASEGRQAFQTPGSGSLRDTAAAVYGLEMGAALLEVAAPSASAGEEGGHARIGVHGLAGPPQLSRAARSYISLFVNRRWVQNRRLVFAVEEAYRGMLMSGRHPVAILNIGVPHGDLDVNVHPTKAEVRFRDESAVFSAVQRAVRAALVSRAPVASGSRESAVVEPAPALVLSARPWTPPLWQAALRREAAVAVAEPQSADEPGAAEAATAQADRPGSTPSQALPVLRVIGQFGGIYIIAEGPEGMYLIDQHAAHERVLYERFASARARREPDVQGLLEPVTLELPVRQRAVIEAEQESLADHGFGLERFGEGAWLLRALPEALCAGDLRENVARFLDVMIEEGEADGRDRVAMSLACHGAIRAGKTLAAEEMRDLVRQLEQTEAPHTCPHGRPTMVHVSAEMLAKGFGRR